MAEPQVVKQEFSVMQLSTKGLPQEPQDRTACTALPSVSLELNKQTLHLVIDEKSSAAPIQSSGGHL